MSAPRLSVVIPTHDRCTILPKTLAAYADQTARKEILEILIIDDGSTDETGGIAKQIADSSSIPIRYLHQENSGQAAARNHGIREARGELLLFGDDDIIPAPRMVEEHLAWHKRYPDSSVGIVGPAYWAPELHPTPMMKWWGLNGIRFDFPHMKPGRGVSWGAGPFWNTSVKTQFLRENGTFDERFRSYGFEDSELAYRLNKKGYRAIYNPDATGYHYKLVKFSDMCRYRKFIANTPNLEVYQSTEAGRCYLEDQARRRKTLKYKVQVFVTRAVVPILSPLKPVLDSQIRLPGFVYTAFLAYYGSLEAKKESGASSAK